MKITINVETGNDAFRDEEGQVDMATVSINLQEVVRLIGRGQDKGVLRDVNGNKAIFWDTDLTE